MAGAAKADGQGPGAGAQAGGRRLRRFPGRGLRPWRTPPGGRGGLPRLGAWVCPHPRPMCLAPARAPAPPRLRERLPEDSRRARNKHHGPSRKALVLTGTPARKAPLCLEKTRPPSSARPAHHSANTSAASQTPPAQGPPWPGGQRGGRHSHPRTAPGACTHRAAAPEGGCATPHHHSPGGPLGAWRGGGLLQAERSLLPGRSDGGVGVTAETGRGGGRGVWG